MSSDDKKNDDKKKKINQELEFEAWDREHRQHTSPAPEAEAYILPDAERARMELEARLQRGVNGMFEALRNKARQNAIQREHAAINAKLDAELGQEPDRGKDVSTIPQRSPELDPKPRATDIKRPAAVVEIARPAASITEKPAADSPLTLDEIATARKDKVVQLYDLLKRLRDLPNVNKGEEALRSKFEEAFKPLWDAIDQSSALTAKDRKDFFRKLADAGQRERYKFIANILGSTADTVRSWRFPRKPKKQKHA